MGRTADYGAQHISDRSVIFGLSKNRKKNKAYNRREGEDVYLEHILLLHF